MFFSVMFQRAPQTKISERPLLDDRFEEEVTH